MSIDTTAIRSWLETIAAPVSADADPACWIGARNADPDQGTNWCRKCAQEEVDRLNALNPGHEYFIDGGWDTDHDCPPCCEKCGKYLSGHLTGYGVRQEIEEWQGRRITLRGTHAPWQAYTMIQVLDGLDNNNKTDDVDQLRQQRNFLSRLAAIMNRRVAAHGGKA